MRAPSKNLSAVSAVLVQSSTSISASRKWLPVALIFSPWPVMLLLYYFGPIAFRPLAINTLTYLLVVGLVFVLGYQLGWITRRSRPNAFLPSFLAENGFKTLVLVSAVSSTALFFDSLRSGFSFDLLINDPIQGRVLQAAHVTSFLTTISFPFAVLSFSSVLFSLARQTAGVKSGWNLIGLLSVVPLLLSNVLQAGRQTFLILAFLLFAWFVLVYGGKKPRELIAMVVKRLWLILPIVALVLFYFFFIAARRHTVETLTLDTWFRMGSLAPRSTDLAPGRASDDILIGGYSGIYYYTHQLQALDSILTSDIPAEGLGRGVFAWILLQFSRTGIDLTYNDVSVQTALYLNGENMSGWRTGFSTLISDFGVFGSLVGVFVVAFALARFVIGAYVEKTDVHVIAAAWLIAACLFMIQFFPSDGMFTMNLILLLLLRFRRSRASKRGVAVAVVRSHPTSQSLPRRRA